jgi:hypothetical protein
VLDEWVGWCLRLTFGYIGYIEPYVLAGFHTRFFFPMRG